MIFIGQDVTIMMLDDDGEWVDIGAGVFQPQMPMEKPIEEIPICLQLQAVDVSLRCNSPVINFWKPHVVRQTEPFWVKKWRRNR